LRYMEEFGAQPLQISNKRQSEVVQWKKLQAFNVLKTILD
jgi:hypothetical protein